MSEHIDRAAEVMAGTAHRPVMGEAELERELRVRVRAFGGMAIKLAPTENGVPDRLIVMPGGGMYLVELKTDTGNLSPIQMHWHDRIAERGVTVHVVRGLDGVKEWVRWAVDQPSFMRASRKAARGEQR